MSRFFLATTYFAVPVQDPARLRAIGAKECSRRNFFTAIPSGTLCYVRRLTGTDQWMVYFPNGAVLKLSSETARRLLESQRRTDGSVIYDVCGTGQRLADEQNRAAGDRPRRPPPQPREDPEP